MDQLSNCERMWKTPECKARAFTKEPPPACGANAYERHRKALAEARRRDDNCSFPLRQNVNPAADLFPAATDANLSSVYAEILKGTLKPNREQKQFLDHFVARLQVERMEERSRTPASTSAKPFFDLVHGFPGTGKSKVIAWMRVLMEQGLGWTHGVQFVCLAFQNSMAALNGFTIHHWSGIPARSDDGARSMGDSFKLSVKVQCLRVMIIDELSMISAELFATLEFVTSKVVRSRGTYKIQRDGSTRPFGGMNVVLCVDWWQLQPVAGTSLCSNPTDISQGLAQNGMSMLWDNGPDCIQRTWSLTQPVRCNDPRYNEFLRQCRFGCLSAEYYSFIHGLPTLTAAQKTCACNNDVVADPTLGAYKQSWKKLFLEGALDMTKVIQESECKACQKERLRKCRVLPTSGSTPEELKTPPFSTAAAIYSFNVPRYFAIHLRAREFAKQSKRLLGVSRVICLCIATTASCH